MLNRALRLIRVFHDMKQQELAAKLEISNSHLSEIESGTKKPSLALLEKYTEVFKIPLSSILFFSENLDASPSEQKAQQFVSSGVLKIMSFLADKAKRVDED